MAGTIERLPDLGTGHPTSSGADVAEHPMRVMTRRAAGLEPPPWDAEARAAVVAVFDGLAPEWHTRVSPGRVAVVRDALDRGEVSGRTVLEIGSGIGAYSPILADRFDHVVAAELSLEMLRLAADEPASRVLADGSELPFADAAVDAVALVNMLLFPEEVDRVLAPDGRVVWVNAMAESTPIHLRPEEVAAALPGEWSGVSARAGTGLWAVLHRT